MATEFATRSHKGAAFLFLLGFALVATGAGFAFAPHYSWQVTKIAQQAAALGLQNGALIVGGLVTLGLGIVARSVSAPAPVQETNGDSEALQSELRLLNEQVSTKLAQLRTSLLQIGEGLASVSAQQQQTMQNQEQKTGGGDHSQDAVFRLAASLDKLHAHFDERVHAVDLQLRNGFETLLNASNDVRRTLDQGAVSAPAALDARSPHEQGAAPLQAPQAGIDFYGTMQKLDAISGGDQGLGSQAHPGQPQAPFPNPGQSTAFDSLLPEEYRDRY